MFRVSHPSLIFLVFFGPITYCDYSNCSSVSFCPITYCDYANCSSVSYCPITYCEDSLVFH